MKDQPISKNLHSGPEPEINKLFRAVISNHGSDLHLKAGKTPRIRIQGSIRATKGDEINDEKMEAIVFEIMSKEQKEFFMNHGALDFAWQVTPTDRFRVNVFRQRGSISLVARHITSEIPPFEKLHMPAVIEKIAQNHDGMILVTGPTGCGKSTTIASMLDFINRTRACHIVTIEDPLEYLHNDKMAIVNQREVGIDVSTFDDALRSLMRQDPDVVLVGEIRDKETLTAGMRAAETGHLVLGTLHSINCAQTVQRILDLFPQEERELARQTFAMTIRGIVSQTLLPGLKPDVKRVPAVEIMLGNPIIRKLIADERESDIASAIRACQNEGMQDFTESLRKLVEEEYVDLKTALACAPNQEELKMALKGIRASSGSIL